MLILIVARYRRARGSEAEEDGTAVTLTAAEIAQVTGNATANSARLAGHGRAAHGRYASSSSPATTEADRQRSQTRAIEKALRQALARKRRGLPAV